MRLIARARGVVLDRLDAQHPVGGLPLVRPQQVPVSVVRVKECVIAFVRLCMRVCMRERERESERERQCATPHR